MSPAPDPPTTARDQLRRGLAFAAAGRLFEAAAAFQASLRLAPEEVPALLNLGTAWRRLGQRESALPCYRLAAKLAPDDPQALYLLGTLLCELRELDEAIAIHRRALTLAGDQPGVMSDLGSALVLRGAGGKAKDGGTLDGDTLDGDTLDGDTAEGMALLRRAVALAPGWPVAHVNLGVALMRQRRLAAALACFRAAQAADPSCDYARFCESNLHLVRGDFAGGYAMYDAHRAVYPPRYRERRWNGHRLAGTLLLYAQHGLGDTLQFVRYARRAAGLADRVLLQVQPSLMPLLARLPGTVGDTSGGAPITLCPTTARAGRFDAQASLLELPAILGDTQETIPAEVPYLAADPALAALWARRLATDRGFKVGLAWHGNPKQKDGLVRSCRLADMAPVWRLPGVSAYSLQVGAGREELAAETGGGSPQVRDLADLAGGDFDGGAGAFMDTAAVMESLDLVVSIDTSVAHLAGALGRPVWLVVPYWADWRWMLDRGDSPWYPTMRLFRQPRPGDWSTVFAALARELRGRLSPPEARSSSPGGSPPPPAPPTSRRAGRWRRRGRSRR